MTRHAALVALVVALTAATAEATLYRVGPSRANTQLSQVANLLNPGDVIELDAGNTYEWVRFTRPGSATQPIVLRGTGRGAQRPVIDATVSAGTGLQLDTDHYVIEDLVVRDASTRCVYLHGHDLTLRRVQVHTCAKHGILGADEDTGDMTLTEVEVFNQGNFTVPSQFDHPIYIATDHERYPTAVLRIERSWVHDNFSGNSIKSRARNAKFFHNWLETTNGQAHTIEAIGPDGQACPVPNGSNAAQLCNAEIVGNVLIARGNNANMMRLGGDGTGNSFGRYHVVNNTFIANNTFNSSSSAMIRAFGDIDSIELHNNIFWVQFDGIRIVRDVDANGTPEARWVTGRRVTGKNNLVTGSATTYASGVPAQQIAGLTDTIFASTASVFANVSAAALASPAALDLRLTATSPARLAGNAGSTITAGFEVPNATNLPAFQPPLIRPSGVFQATGRPKPTDDSGAIVPNDISLGAYEFVVVPAGLDPAADADGDGVPNGVEVPLGLNVLTKDNDVFADARLFAMQQYRDFLGREGDAAGVNTWTNQVASASMTRAQVVQAFFDSQEFQNGLPQVTRLYFAFFNRIPDYPGLLFHTGRYRVGVPLNTIAQDFAGSQEFQVTYGSLDNGQYVDLVYQNVLGRPADPAGRANALAQLDGGAMTRGDLMVAFSESQEHLSLSASDVFVTSIYVGMLRRSPDPAGLQNWVNAFANGMPRVQMLQAFMSSPEYHNRFLP